MSDNDDWSNVSSKKAPPKNEVKGFEHQNWEPTILKGKPKTTNSIQPKVNRDPEAIRLAKLENDEPIKVKSLSNEARQELIKGRVAKGLNQEKTAQALAIQANMYKDIENGKIIPNQNILTKINNFLGTKVKLT
jgi:ribosome-binding protein aMBF1 (putative translation factor)